MAIRILDAAVAAKIAAGEVVERPVSVVKELVENCLDAGARHITVEILGGGMELIRVTDDGQGIPVLDLELAFERHATSKLVQETDLERIATLGFRGEALPSIAAVSHVTLSSRERGRDQGAIIHLRGGEIVRKGAAGGPEGTTVTVRDLFFNVPARRKFLRSEAAEGSRIYTLVTQLALAHPEVRFRMLANERERLACPGNGSFRDILARVYKADVVDSLLGVAASDGEGRRTWGCVSAPSQTRPNRSAINFYVNRRWVQSRLLSQAVEEAYLGLLMQGRHPVVSLHIELPPEEVDVNVHPTKREVRIHQEGPLFSLVQRAVREVLVAHSPVPVVQPDTPRAGPMAFRPEPVPTGGTAAVQQRMQSQEGYVQEGTEKEEATQPLFNRALPALRVLGQASATYIVAEGPEGVYLIDQHAAHERILFEEVRQRSREGRPDVQGLLEPLTVELLPVQMQTVETQRSLLESYGFRGELFGERTFLLRGVPGTLRNTGPDRLLMEVLELLGQVRDAAHAGDSLAASIACHSAVRAGDTLGQEEMGALVRQLEATESPHTCPHGRPTMLHLSASSLEREFGRR